MAKDESFDITTGCDLQEVDNAVNQARKEIASRFDFKGVLAEVDYDRAKGAIDIHTTDDYKLDAIWQVLSARLIARNVPLQNLKREDAEKAGGGTLRQHITLTQGIDSDIAKSIVKYIKEQKLKKVQAQVQGDAVRVTAPNRDDLQLAIQALKTQDYGIELKFGNYR